MASLPLLGLPPISSELKSIIPYLQRADELKPQEPIVAYWCAYYAAQLGISLRARDSASRTILLELLTVLERMKNEIGPHDAIDMEAASAAYVENFALKVFSMADNEDRSDRATRGTAKKFLAAVNFLEVLKTFPKSDVADTNEEKIRYAKWKAADIAKAYREGRKPTPGPAGSIAENDQQISPPLIQPNDPSHLATQDPSLLSRSKPSRSPPRSNSTANLPQSSSPLRRNNLGVGVPTNNTLGIPGETSPGNWSTAATPGTTHGGTFPTSIPFTSTTSEPYGREHGSPTRNGTSREKSSSRTRDEKRHKPRSGSGSSSGSGNGNSNSSPRNGGVLKKAHVSEPEGKPSPGSSLPRSGETSPKRVHFTPSVVGGSTTTGSPPPSPGPESLPSGYQGPTSIYLGIPPQPPVTTPPTLPTGFVSDIHMQPPPSLGPTAPPRPSPSNIYTPTPPHQTGSPPRGSPPKHNIYAPPLPSPHTQPTVVPSIPPPQRMHPAPPELTPSLIAKAQKHCRFAISALDYEDAEQARKELRAALALLGG